MSAAPLTRYRTIVADPPWPYPQGHIRTAATGHSHNRNRDGAKAIQGADVRRDLPYKQLSLLEIGDMPVGDLAHPAGCRLFLWTTNYYLPAAFFVSQRWGFTYKQLIVWYKADGGPFPAHLAPNTAEYLLVAVSGKPERIGTIRSSVVRVGAPKSHSAKPEVFLDIAEQTSPGPYLELFARRQRLGWDTWGDEAFDHLGGALAHKGEARTAPAVPRVAPSATGGTP